MSILTVESTQLKTIISDAFSEVLNNNKEMLYNLIYEALEDMQLYHAIKEGENTPIVKRDEVFAILES